MSNTIRDLGIIGDRRTCALITKQGEVVWYCPRRFDKAAYFSSLIDPLKGGYWKFSFPGKKYITRNYEERSAVLTTEFSGMVVDDFMPLDKHHNGICRIFSAAPAAVENVIYLKPFYGLGLPEYSSVSGTNCISISRSLFLTASHPLWVSNGKARFTIPEGEKRMGLSFR